jgi:hypothetical protein
MAQRLSGSAFVALLLAPCALALSAFGVVGMDGLSFAKIVDGSTPVLVRFAKAGIQFPH